jgi:hypothetical protein
MAVTAYIYNSAKQNFFDGNATDLDATSALKVALFTSTYTPALTDTLYSGLSGEVANGNGYTTGGATVTGGAFSGTTTKVFDATDTSWTFTASKIARYAVLYDASTSKVIMYLDFGSDQTSSNLFTIQWNASGILNITSS